MHDINGKPVKKGDTVLVPFVVASTHGNTDYCNATLDTVHPMFPGKDKTCLTINTKQFAVCDPELVEALTSHPAGVQAALGDGAFLRKWGPTLLSILGSLLAGATNPPAPPVVPPTA